MQVLILINNQVIVTEYLYWGIIECGIGILAACIPTVRFLVKDWSWAPLSSTARSLFNSKRSKPEYSVAREDTGTISAGMYHTPLSKQGSGPKISNSTLSVKGGENYSMERIAARDVI